MALPFAPGAVRELLRSDEKLTAMIGDDPELITTGKLPSPLLRPCITLQSGVNIRENIRLSRVRVMGSVWVPPAEVLVDMDPPILTDPEELAWDIAAQAGQVIDRRAPMGGGQFQFRGWNWKGEWLTGPITMVDTDRGPSNPMYRAVIEVLVKGTSRL